jgi:hypothetical protein
MAGTAPTQQKWLVAMPYLAPEAAMPMTSWAPRLADRKASPATHAGIERPERK